MILRLYSLMNRFNFQLKAHHADKFYGSKARQAVRHHLPQEQEHLRTLTDILFEKQHYNLKGTLILMTRLFHLLFVFFVLGDSVTE